MSSQDLTLPSPSELVTGVAGLFGIRLSIDLEFRTLRQDHDFSLREYPAYAEASTTDQAERSKAADDSFRELFSYIHCNNSESTRIRMTTPVFQEEISKGWRTSFYLPGSPNSFPKPLVKSVRI